MTGRCLSQVRAGLALAAVYGLLASAAASAQTPAPALTGNPHHGKQLSYTCLGCHGVEGYRNAYPDYSVPRLKGQHPEYLIAALTEYRSGERAHLTMHDQASTLSDQDIADIASFFAGKPLVTTPRPAGSTPPPASATLCVSCHGADCVGIAPTYPSLAGQHEDYLERALEEYRKGGRKNPVMAGFAANLKPEDIAAISAYFSKLEPSLSVEPRPYTSFSLGSSE
jgi:cytochrome c553